MSDRQIDVTAGPDPEIVFRMSPRDLFILQAAVREADQELEDWEFELRMGVSREAAYELLQFLSREVDRVSALLKGGRLDDQERQEH